MKTLSLLLTIIIFALLGMGFYLNDKVERLEAKFIQSDTLITNHLRVGESLFSYGHLFSETITSEGLIYSQEKLMTKNVSINSENIKLGKDGDESRILISSEAMFLQDIYHKHTIMITPDGISFLALKDKELEEVKSFTWEEITSK